MGVLIADASAMILCAAFVRRAPGDEPVMLDEAYAWAAAAG
ncbi:hypothetical protein [Burkholderia lata]|nr:hypothetical protein [Burkholderia lata]